MTNISAVVYILRRALERKDIYIGITLSASYGPPALLFVHAIMSGPYVTLGYVMILTQGHMCKFKVPGRKSA